jgi:hypothetical protein
MTERRNEGRYLCADLVRVDWLAGEDDYRTEQALLEDISEVGGCVQMDEPVQLGATIMLRIGEAFFAGHVCYCVYRDYGYFVGMRFAEDTVWTEDQVVPQHLTNLQALARAQPSAGH